MEGEPREGVDPRLTSAGASVDGCSLVPEAAAPVLVPSTATVPSFFFWKTLPAVPLLFAFRSGVIGKGSPVLLAPECFPTPC